MFVQHTLAVWQIGDSSIRRGAGVDYEVANSKSYSENHLYAHGEQHNVPLERGREHTQ
jgi:hypothetical protein